MCKEKSPKRPKLASHDDGKTDELKNGKRGGGSQFWVLGHNPPLYSDEK
jgi:hypothetical protein